MTLKALALAALLPLAAQAADMPDTRKVLNVASVSPLAEALERIDDGAFAGGPRGR